MCLWHYTTSKTVAANLKVGDWIVTGDECQKMLGLTRNERSTTYTFAYGDGVCVEYEDETWTHTYPNEHTVTLIRFDRRDTA